MYVSTDAFTATPTTASYLSINSGSTWTTDSTSSSSNSYDIAATADFSKVYAINANGLYVKNQIFPSASPTRSPIRLPSAKPTARPSAPRKSLS